MSATTMPTRTAAFLVANALGHVWSATEDPDVRGCCPGCCAPCSALRSLFASPSSPTVSTQLDDLYGAYVATVGGDHEIWDAGKRQVRRDWLLGAWSVDLGCRDDHGEANGRG